MFNGQNNSDRFYSARRIKLDPIAIIFTTLLLLSPCGLTQANNSAANLPIDGVEITHGGNVIRYLPVYFSSSNASNAKDLLRRIPGVADIVKDVGSNDEEKRGFGSSGDQVLINGKRISGKANDISTSLERIPVSKITGIEVIRGTKEGLDVRSEGLLVNILLSDEGGVSGSWQLNHWSMGQHSDTDVDGKFSLASSLGNLQYQLGVEYGPYNSYSYRTREHNYYDVGGQLTERRYDNSAIDDDNLTLTTALSYPFSNGSLLNINAQWKDLKNKLARKINVYDTDQSGLLNYQKDQFNDYLTKGNNWELGGDYELAIGSGVLKSRIIYSHKESEKSNLSSLQAVAGNSDSRSINGVEYTDNKSTESIVRSSYRFSLSGSQSLELGFEGALNTLDKSIEKLTAQAGLLTPLAVPNSDSEVEEKRAELFATHFYTISDDSALETALNWETSTIKQQGSQVDTARSLSYLKPRLALRHDLDEQRQLRLSAERTVSQLNFEDFIAAFDDTNDIIVLGNPDLEPEKTWLYSLAYEQRFADNSGLVAVKSFYKDISDHVDKVDIGGSNSATGNIGDAQVWGLELKNSFNLSRFGAENISVDTIYTWQDSEVVDPFLNSSRSLIDLPEHKFFAKIRHDIPRWDVSYWLEIDWKSQHFEYDIDKIYKNKRNPEARLFVEKKLKDSFSLWFNIRSMFNDYSSREARYYSDTTAGALQSIEMRDQRWLREIIIGIKGAF